MGVVLNRNKNEGSAVEFFESAWAFLALENASRRIESGGSSIISPG